LSNQGCDLGPLGISDRSNGDKPFREPIPLQQTTPVNQSDAVDEIQPHLPPLDADLADRPFDSAANRGTMIRQTAP
jgi:hypothetical protein